MHEYSQLIIKMLDRPGLEIELGELHTISLSRSHSHERVLFIYSTYRYTPLSSFLLAITAVGQWIRKHPHRTDFWTASSVIPPLFPPVHPKK